MLSKCLSAGTVARRENLVVAHKEIIWVTGALVRPGEDVQDIRWKLANFCELGTPSKFQRPIPDYHQAEPQSPEQSHVLSQMLKYLATPMDCRGVK
jgi:hypothetical protein